MTVALRQSIEKDFCLSLLDAAIQDKHAEIAEVGAWFDLKWLMDPLYAALAEVAFDLVRQNKPLSNSTLAAGLIQAKAKAGQDLTAVWELLAQHFGWYHLTYYGREVYNEYRRSAAASDLDDSAANLREGQDVTKELDDISVLPEKYHELNITRTDRADEAVEAIISEMEGRSMPRFMTGLDELDSLKEGFRNGTLTTVAAPTGGGKSVFLGQLAITRVMRDHLDALFFSAEMSTQELIERWSSFVSGAKKDRRDQQQRRLFIEGLNRVRQWTRKTGPLQVFEGPRHVDHILAAARAYTANHKLGIVCVDYVQLFIGGHPKETRERQVADITANLKALAMECHVPVFVASQYNRQHTGTPTMANLRDSGSIADDSDVVLLLDHDPTSRDETIAMEITIGKHRGGKKGVCTITWDRPIYTLRSKDVPPHEEFASYAP